MGALVVDTAPLSSLFLHVAKGLCSLTACGHETITCPFHTWLAGESSCCSHECSGPVHLPRPLCSCSWSCCPKVTDWVARGPGRCLVITSSIPCLSNEELWNSGYKIQNKELWFCSCPTAEILLVRALGNGSVSTLSKAKLHLQWAFLYPDTCLNPPRGMVSHRET